MIVPFISILTGQNHVSSESLFINVIEFVLNFEILIILMELIWFISVAGECLRYIFSFPACY